MELVGRAGAGGIVEAEAPFVREDGLDRPSTPPRQQWLLTGVESSADCALGE